MKRILALSLVIVMLLFMVSCDYFPFLQSLTDTDNDTDNDTNNDTNNDTGIDTGAKESVELSRGTIEGRVYTSEYLGLSFKRPVTWKFATDEEIANALNVGVDMFVKDRFKEALENTPTIYDMMAVDNITGSNVNIGIENLEKSASSDITVNRYIEILKIQLNSMTHMQVTFPNEYDTVKLGEIEFTRVICKVRTATSSMDQIYYLNKEGKYMRFVIVTINSGYTVEKIEAMFS